MPASWKHDDVFPIIARAISQCSPDGQYATHDEIFDALMNDPEASAIIKQAHDDQAEQNRTIEWFAHNMIAWFSQQITVGKSQWTNTFDRKNIDGKWAYRPREERAQPVVS